MVAIERALLKTGNALSASIHPFHLIMRLVLCGFMSSVQEAFPTSTSLGENNAT